MQSNSHKNMLHLSLAIPWLEPDSLQALRCCSRELSECVTPAVRQECVDRAVARYTRACFLSPPKSVRLHSRLGWTVADLTVRETPNRCGENAHLRLNNGVEYSGIIGTIAYDDGGYSKNMGPALFAQGRVWLSAVRTVGNTAFLRINIDREGDRPRYMDLVFFFPAVMN